METEQFSILESCLGKLISKNSLFEGLSMRRFADIDEETSAIALSRKETVSRNLLEEKGISDMCDDALVRRKLVHFCCTQQFHSVNFLINNV
jgi:hypothetical protein